MISYFPIIACPVVLFHKIFMAFVNYFTLACNNIVVIHEMRTRRLFVFCSEISKPLLPVGRVGILLGEILHLLCKQMVRFLKLVLCLNGSFCTSRKHVRYLYMLECSIVIHIFYGSYFLIVLLLCWMYHNSFGHDAEVFLKLCSEPAWIVTIRFIMFLCSYAFIW